MASSDLQTKFDTTAESVKEFKPTTPLTDEEKLAAYKYYKQATVGDVNTDK
jgi:acyl-CoA-binding protein